MSEGLFGGFSAGANIAAAAALLRGECRGETVAVVICDSGLKYDACGINRPFQTMHD